MAVGVSLGSAMGGEQGAGGRRSGGVGGEVRYLTLAKCLPESLNATYS